MKRYLFALLVLCTTGFTCLGAQTPSFTYTNLHEFGGPLAGSQTPDGSSPACDVLVGRDGRLYGTASTGGLVNKGLIWSMKQDGTDYKVLHQFAGGTSDGASPTDLMETADGLLFGTTESGGASDKGTVFRIAKDGSGYLILHHFAGGQDGADPVGRLLVASDGYLYGTTVSGGIHDSSSWNHGTVFRLTEQGANYSVVYVFEGCAGGSDPRGALIEDGGRVLWGTTSSGWSQNSCLPGTPAGGTVFKLSLDTGACQWVQQFTGFRTGLLLASDGLLYGALGEVTTSQRGDLIVIPGGIISFPTSLVYPNTAHDVFDFGDSHLSDGEAPNGPLIEGIDGRLYGTCRYGGSSTQGVVFAVQRDGTGYQKIHDFSGPEGAYPRNGLTSSYADGRIYGTVSWGGASNVGVVYCLIPSIVNHVATNLVLSSLEVREGLPRKTPVGVLTAMDPDAGDTFTYALVGGDGATDNSLFTISGKSLLTARTLNATERASADIRVRATDAGGLSIEKHFNIRILPDRLNFDRTVIGLSPSIPGSGVIDVVEGPDGWLYGITQAGTICTNGTCTNHFGTVYKLRKDGSGLSVLHVFGLSAGDGKYPVGRLAVSQDGVVFGFTYTGGQWTNLTSHSDGGGILYSIRTDGSDYRVLIDFGQAKGDAFSPPHERPVLGKDGALYGVAQSGGAANCGVVFKVNTNGTGYTVLHEFTPSTSNQDGAGPGAGLIEASDGNLYGTTTYGGSRSGCGTVFRLGKDGSGYQVIHRFTGYPTDGEAPESGELLEGADGALYGLTLNGGTNGIGVAFKAGKDGGGYQVLHSFGGTGDGMGCYSPLVKGADGFIYGTTRGGGDNSAGTLFALQGDGSNYSLLWSFPTVAGGGINPGTLLLASDGAFYGTTTYMGNTPFGSIFRLTFLSPPFNRLSCQLLSDILRLRFSGSPGQIYVIQRANLETTIQWTNIGTNVAPANGIITVVDPNPPEGGAFYRIQRP